MVESQKPTAAMLKSSCVPMEVAMGSFKKPHAFDPLDMEIISARSLGSRSRPANLTDRERLRFSPSVPAGDSRVESHELSCPFPYVLMPCR